jgi:hypothetical protein
MTALAPMQEQLSEESRWDFSAYPSRSRRTLTPFREVGRSRGRQLRVPSATHACVLSRQKAASHLRRAE